MDEDIFDLREELVQLKEYLLRWEQQFALEHGRKPTMADIDVRPDVGKLGVLLQEHYVPAFLDSNLIAIVQSTVQLDATGAMTTSKSSWRICLKDGCHLLND